MTERGDDMKKKMRARILIEGYEDPNDGHTCDLHYDGKDAEIVALLFRCAVEVCRKDLELSDSQIIDMFTHCVSLGDQDV